MFFFEGVKGKGFFGILEKLTVCFDLILKSLYLFVSYSAELYSVHSSVPEGKLDSFLKIRSSVLNFAFLSFVDRLSILFFLIRNEKKSNFFNNNLGAQRLITYFYDSSKRVGIFLDT